MLGIGVALGADTFVPAAAPSPLLTNLVAYHTFDEASGNRADSTGSGNTEVPSGTVTQVAGLIGHAAHGDGSTGYLTCASPSFTLSHGTAFSGAVWINVDNAVTGNLCIVARDAAANNRDFRVNWTSSNSGQATFSVADSGVNFNAITSPPASVPTGGWHFLTFGYDPSVPLQWLRVDGGEIVKDTTYSAGTNGSTAALTFLRLDETGTQFAQLAVDEAAIYSGRSIDAQDALAIYNRGAGQTYPYPANAWVKYNTNANPSILAATGGDIGVAEPRPWQSSHTGGWVMSYTRVITTGSSLINRATSSDGIAWTVSGTLIGNGTGGESSTTVARSCVLVDGSTTYVFYADTSTGLVNVATSSDDVTFTRSATNIFPSAGITGWTAFANSSVVKDGSTYRAIVEWKDASKWHLAYFTSTSPTSGWTLQVAHYTTLEYASGTASGPDLHKTGGGTWAIWFHRGTPDGLVLPSRIFYATSSNLTDNWVIGSNGYPVIAITESSTLTGNHPVDQVADARVIDMGTSTRLYYDCDENSSGYHASICLAVYPAGLAQLITDGG